MARKKKESRNDCPNGIFCPNFNPQIPTLIERINTDIKWLKKEMNEVKKGLEKLEGRLWQIVVTVALGIIASGIFAFLISKLF